MRAIVLRAIFVLSDSTRMTRLLSLPLFGCVLCIGWGIARAQDAPTVAQFRRDWQHAKPISLDQTVAESKDLTDAERRDLVRAVVSQLRSPKSDVDKAAKQNLEDEAAQFRVRATDLSGNGKGKVLLVQGGGEHDCSPTGNCSFWILRRGARGYSVILHGVGQTLSVLPAAENGLRDVVLGMHGSATMTALKVYRFNSAAYQRMGCFSENWQYLGEDGEVHELDEPRITLCGQ